MIDNRFKTVYFPREKTRSGKSARVSIYIFEGSCKIPSEYLKSLSSREFRLMMGDPFLEDIEIQAQSEGISFSDACLRLIEQSRESLAYAADIKSEITTQLEISLGAVKPKVIARGSTNYKDIGITFRESLHQGAHGWYPYVEGFSATYVRDTILRDTLPSTIYDPFGGCGTALLAASALGIPSFYSEINPFMSFVAETKVNAALWARSNLGIFRELCQEYINLLHPENLNKVDIDEDMKSFERAFPKRDFFEEDHLRNLLAARKLAIKITENLSAVQNLLLLACASNAVNSSHMTRRADLRRRRADEYKTRVVDVPQFIISSVERFLRDVAQLSLNHVKTTKISNDCRVIPESYCNSFDLAITSPPYPNGTNYFRNTKIELWLLGFIQTEKELPNLCSQAVTSGINNVISTRREYTKFEAVEEIADKLDLCAKDKRIPKLIRHYFSDMQDVMSSVYSSLVPGGKFFLDIGDSKFYGIHIPTDKLIADLARSVGFEVEHEQIIAKRYSRDKTELIQSEILLRK